MELTLKNVKVHDGMSEETVCFSATVYVDNHKIGTVVNRGHGGSHEYQWTDEVMGHALEDWAKKEVIVTEDPTDPEKVMFIDFEKLDWKIDEALEVVESAKWYKARCRNKTLFKLKSDNDASDEESWRTVKAVFGPRVKTWLIDRFGDDLGEIANERFV